MKKIMTVAFLLCSAVFVWSQELPKIAVYVTGDLRESEKRALGTEILGALVKSGRYKAVERSTAFVEMIDKEMVTQHSGAVDDSQIRELGKQFGVVYICVVDVASAFGEHQMSARVIDVETAEVVALGKASGALNDLRAVVTVSEAVVNNMFALDTEVKKEYISEFTFDERGRMVLWNLVIPGTGSLFITHDLLGAAGSIAIGVCGVSLAISGFSNGGDAGDLQKQASIYVYIFGGVAWSAYRSIFYKKPRPKESRQSAVGNGLNLAVFPDANGSLKAYARYDIQF